MFTCPFCVLCVVFDQTNLPDVHTELKLKKFASEGVGVLKCWSWNFSLRTFRFKSSWVPAVEIVHVWWNKVLSEGDTRWKQDGERFETTRRLQCVWRWPSLSFVTNDNMVFTHLNCLHQVHVLEQNKILLPTLLCRCPDGDLVTALLSVTCQLWGNTLKKSGLLSVLRVSWKSMWWTNYQDD